MHLLLLLAVFDSSVARGAHPLQRSAAIMAATRQVCGDGTYESPESCDDGNIASGDGCSSTCTVEAGYACTGSPSICVDDPQFYALLTTSGLLSLSRSLTVTPLIVSERDRLKSPLVVNSA